ncbi:MAG: phosphatidylinositol mannoside acyltransferase [Actinobacteria bacterium]|nr:MAG: phosphatidylinositol mannoside acyltransferase [Actinomycetota bacterium]
MRQFPVLLCPGPGRGAGLLRRGEPRHARPAVRARGYRAAGQRARLGGLGCGRDLGPRGRGPYGSGRPRRPVVSETALSGPREWLAYRAFATVGWLGRTIPTQTGRMLFRWAGSLAYHVAPRARSTVAANQAMVLGRAVDDPLVQAVTKEAFRRYARYWFDAFDVVDWSDDRIDAAFAWNGIEHLADPVAAGTGVIAVLPHMGNWDAAGRAMLQRGLPVVSVAERLRPEELFRLFLEHRQALGMTIIGLDQNGRVGRALTSALAEGRVVALVADRDLTGRGVEVEMFGGRRKLPAGPALLALSSDAPIVVASIYETPTGWRCVLHPLAEVPRTGSRREDARAITMEIARAFERAISASPPDWHLFQPGWSDRDGT